MNETKKLTKLLRDLDVYAYNTSFENQAQFLIANGVTFAKDNVEVAHGHWLIDKSFMPFISTCSECGAVYDIDGAFDWKFCPICGARMDAQ